MDKEKIGQIFDELLMGLYVANATNTDLVHITAKTAQALIDILTDLYREK